MREEKRRDHEKKSFNRILLDYDPDSDDETRYAVDEAENARNNQPNGNVAIYWTFVSIYDSCFVLFL